jgi:signal peptidase I
MINKPRKCWIAGVLSLICPGAGHIYVGEARKAIAILALPLLLYPAMILCLNSNLIVYFLVSFFVGGITYYAGVIIDAIRKARRLRDQYSLKKYNPNPA